MGEAQTRLCPFKPLVAGSSPAALTKLTLKAQGLFFINALNQWSPFDCRECRSVSPIYLSKVAPRLSQNRLRCLFWFLISYIRILIRCLVGLGRRPRRGKSPPITGLGLIC